jgi:hypothetical protein
MALTLIATPAATNANTYCTLAEAETYFEARLNITEWTAASDANKNIALTMATRLLDERMQWSGSAYTETQALSFPRYSVYDSNGIVFDETTIPQWLINATAEFAFHLLKSDRTAEAGTKGIRYMRVDKIAMSLDKTDRSGVIPTTVWEMVRYYGTKIGAAKQLVRC